MVNIKYYLVTYDQCSQKAVANLTDDERNKVNCYAVVATKLKSITAKINITKEWKLPWHDNRYQFLNYYEYSLFPHIYKNPELHEGLTHIGILQSDVLFAKNSINDMISKLEINSNKIFYILLRKSDVLYFTDNQLEKICNYMENKLDIKIDINKISNEWICETMAIAPKEIFLKFAKYIYDNQYEIENMLITNRWGLMNTIKHRISGIIERMWGIYLVSCGMPIEQMNVIHDRDSYEHQHLIDKQKYLNNTL